MAMDFFGSQDRARRKTGLLVFLFICAVIGIIAAVYLLIAGVLGGLLELEGLWQPKILLIVTGLTVTIVGLSSLYKLMQLSGGGSVVAESLGGRQLFYESADANQKKLLNVVEEMAIASGVPVPPVYLLEEEEQINAFAAGYKPEDAVIGVTRGCCEKLNRAELQGVIAHEFSHILNGDMRLNIRMIGILSGILVIGAIGYTTLRLVFYSGASHRRRGGFHMSLGGGSSSSSRKDGGGAIILAILAIAVGLMVIGFIGTFFGKLIKAAISRQREFLADASAVQFTRHPEGIAGALKKIGTAGAAVHHANADEASHMFFSQALTSGLDSMLATHPPLNKRILRIDPSWKGDFPDLQATDADGAPVSGFAGGAAAGPDVTLERGSLGESVDRVGQVDPEHLQQAETLIGRLPEALRDAARTPFGARGVIYLLLMDEKQEVARKQWQRLQDHAEPEVARWARDKQSLVQQIDRTDRLVLLDLAVPQLKALTRSQRPAFLANLKSLSHADAQLDLFEWMLLRIVRHALGLDRNRAAKTDLSRKRALCVLISTLAHAGHTEAEATEKAFAAGLQRLRIDGKIQPAAECNLNRLAEALDVLSAASGKQKKTILQACAACVEADQVVTINEAELLRAVAADLGCPMPPHLPG
ncbi:MAG: M48 family metallopeptidase [Phycisphaeraceae bacterium]|nr:M48 family metallopeptidase [Phycisphaeraceae bacterium]